MEWEKIMRCVYNIEVKVDIDANDDTQRAAFIELVSQSARSIYGPAVMIAKRPSTITLHETSREGKRELPLFETADSE
jgi:hypothetical protein